MTSGYLLCASPRSGSTLLCDLLSRTGVAGNPESYFRPASVSLFAASWGVLAEADTWDERYVEAVRRKGAGATGCSSLRIMWSDMPVFLAKLRMLYPADDGDASLLMRRLDTGHFVHLFREDKVAQAVSLVLARQTGLWHLNADGSDRQRVGPRREPRYDYDQIASELRMLDDEARGWEQWFGSQGISPMQVEYRDLVTDPADTVRQIMKMIGRPVPGLLPFPGTARLATALNDEWVERFRSTTKR